MRGNLIETYKIIKGLDTLVAGNMIPLMGESRTGGHSFRIRGKPFRTEMRKTFFTQRVVDMWNSLQQKAVVVTSLDAFRRELDRALIDSGAMDMGRSRNGVLTVDDQP